MRWMVLVVGLGLSSLSSCVVQQRACDFGYTNCGDYCADLSYDARDCGACGASCAIGDSCNQGLCYRSTCWADGEGCRYDNECCSGFCASDGACGCMAPGTYGCAQNLDCCTNYCGYDGYCR